ncbi:MAG: FeoB-associated Cys-rich membrane protein, partial [Alloprevotella sp.]|nr:FeoB-associated Cys-rich membrane protein [Alloprevotella sp.]
MQSVLVALILALCAAYVLRRLWLHLRRPPCDARCADCPLAARCGR